LFTFSWVVFNAVLQKSVADKNFIAAVAKRATTSCAQIVADHITARILLESVISKNLSLSEFAITTLNSAVVSSVASSFFEEPPIDNLVYEMCVVMEGKKPRMVKHAVPILNACKEALTRSTLFDKCVQVLSSHETEEECKNNSCEQVQERVSRIFKSLEVPTKKVDKSKDFRAFMRSQKVESKEMTMGEAGRDPSATLTHPKFG
jgi:hypothetical protein